MEIFDLSDSFFTCYQGDIFVFLLQTVLYPPAEAHSQPSPVKRLNWNFSKNSKPGAYLDLLCVQQLDMLPLVKIMQSSILMQNTFD